MNSKTTVTHGAKAISRSRHEFPCRICKHAQGADIEEGFVNWVSTAPIRQAIYGVSHDAIYRHAHVFGLMGQRRRNVRAGYWRFSWFCVDGQPFNSACSHVPQVISTRSLHLPAFASHLHCVVPIFVAELESRLCLL